MGITNTILIVAGVIVALFGIGAFLHPNLARWINAPGTPIIKAIIALVIGIIIIIVGFVFQFTV
jgi:hypothetical protein